MTETSRMDTSEPPEVSLSRIRRSVAGANAAAICSAEGLILAVDSEPEIDESVLGDVVSAAAALRSALVDDDDPDRTITAVLAGPRRALAARRLASGSWASIAVRDSAHLGAALLALEGLESPTPARDGER